MRNLIFICLVVVLIGYSCSSKVEEEPVDCKSVGLLLTSEVTDSACGADDGTVTINAVGGSAPYTYALDGSSQSESTFTNVPAGNFQVSLTDVNGCFTMGEVLVKNSNDFFASSTVEPTGCKTSDGVLTVNVENGTAPFTYSFDGASSQPSNTKDGLPTGTHTVMITDDEGCSFELNVALTSGVSYSQTIFPIFVKSCAVTDCHDSPPLPNFNEFSIVKSLAGRIKLRTGRGTMPPIEKDPISQEEIDLIACWVDDGALQN